jgi:tryptophan-rich hypothetical protein
VHPFTWQLSFAMNRFNPDKLLLSKWTASRPQLKEKHFLVIELQRDENDVLLQVELQAVHSRRSIWIDWRELRDDQTWLFGWR